MKVLLSIVGEQDPISEKTNSEGSIVTLCRHIKPQLVYLLPTAKGYNISSETETNAFNTEHWIKTEIDKDIKVFIKPIKLNNPTDYSLIIPVIRRSVNDILSEMEHEEKEIHINCSSGTPQLKSTWLILANAGVFPNSRLWQVANPEYCKGDRITEIELTLLEEENILSRVKKLAAEFMFQRLAEECLKLKEISIYSYRKEKAALAERIFSAYQSWDLICYDDAYRRLSSVYRDIEKSKDLTELKDCLARQLEVLGKLKENSTKENKYNLFDLYFNAERRLIRKDYTDTLARFWRLYEGSLFYLLRGYYGIEPTLSESSNQEDVKKINDYFANKPNKLSMFSAAIVLEKIYQDSVFLQLSKINVQAVRSNSSKKMAVSRLLEELRERRNESIVAHGMKPVSEKDARNSIMVMAVILKLFFNLDSELFDGYPFQLEQVELVITSLEEAFSK